MNHSLTSTEFRLFIEDVFNRYKELLETDLPSISDQRDKADVKSILNMKSLLQPTYGLAMLIFGKNKQDRDFQYSLKDKVLQSDNQIQEDGIDIGDIIYKKCYQYKKGEKKLTIPDWLMKFSGYNSLEEFIDAKEIMHSSLGEVVKIKSKDEHLEEILKGILACLLL